MLSNTSLLYHQSTTKLTSYTIPLIIKPVLLLCLEKKIFDLSQKYRIYRAKYSEINIIRRKKKQEQCLYIWMLMPLILRQKFGL